MINLLKGISARRIMKDVQKIEKIGPRPDGSPEDQAVVNYLRETFTSLDLEIKSNLIKVPVVENLQTSLKILSPGEREIRCEANMRSGMTEEKGITAPLELVGKAFDTDFRNLAKFLATFLCFSLLDTNLSENFLF